MTLISQRFSRRWNCLHAAWKLVGKEMAQGFILWNLFLHEVRSYKKSKDSSEVFGCAGVVLIVEKTQLLNYDGSET